MFISYFSYYFGLIKDDGEEKYIYIYFTRPKCLQTHPRKLKLSSRVQVSQVGGARLKYSRRRKSFRDLICPLERTGNPPASEERKEGEFGRRGDKRRTRRVRNRCVRGTRGFLGMGPPLGSSSHKTPRDLSSFSSFVISHLQQNRADERERERDPRRLDFTQNIRERERRLGQTARQILPLLNGPS